MSLVLQLSVLILVTVTKTLLYTIIHVDICCKLLDLCTFCELSVNADFSKFQSNSSHCCMKYLVLFALCCGHRLFTNSEVCAKNAGNGTVPTHN